MKPKGRSKATDSSNKVKGKAVGSKNGKKNSKEASTRKVPRVSAAALKTHPVKKMSSVENIQPRTRTQTSLSSESYREKVISGKALSKWKVMPKASQAQIINVLDSVTSAVLNNTNDVVYNEVQGHLNQLKRRIVRSLSTLKVPPVKDYSKLQQQCKLLEETLVETNQRSDRLDEEIDEIEKLIEEREENLAALESEAVAAENNNDRHIHPAVQAPYINQLGLPPLPSPVCYFSGKNQDDDDLHLQLELLKSTTNNSQEISQYMHTLLNQVRSLP